jgi:hypothetical protein
MIDFTNNGGYIFTLKGEPYVSLKMVWLELKKNIINVYRVQALLGEGPSPQEFKDYGMEKLYLKESRY